MGGISSPGVGSGLDTASIVRQLVSAERAGPERRLLRAETETSTKLSAYGSLKAQVADFTDALDGLKGITGTKKASPTNADAFTVSAKAEAPLGTCNGEVTQLAQPESIASAVFASREEALGTGTLSLAVGDDAPVEITLAEGSNTLADLRSAINEADLPISANIINDGAGERLVLQSSRPGAAETISLTVADDDGDNADGSGLSRLAESTFETLVSARDAELKLNGLAITRSTNQITDAMEGITLTLKAPSEGAAETVAVTSDNSSTKAALDKFAKAYNSLNDFISRNTAYDADTQQGGPLLGDSTLRSLESALRNTLLASSEAVAGARSLVDLGLKTSATGTISREGTALDDALEVDPDGVNALLERLGESIESRFARFDGAQGLVAARIDGLEARLDGIDDRRTRLDRRMESVQARYQREFSALDGLIAGMNQTSSYLSAQLSSLGRA